MSYVTRISSIEMTNFRNIGYGKVNFENSKIDNIINEEPSITGLYGQNGSGKTSILLALKVLKATLNGETLSFEDYGSIIKVGCNYCKLKFEFFTSDFVDNKEDECCNDNYYFSYEFNIEDKDGQLAINKEILKGKKLGNSETSTSLLTLADFGDCYDPNNDIVDKMISKFITNKGKKYANGNFKLAVEEFDKRCCSSLFGDKYKFEECSLFNDFQKEFFYSPLMNFLNLIDSEYISKIVYKNEYEIMTKRLKEIIEEGNCSSSDDEFINARAECRNRIFEFWSNKDFGRSEEGIVKTSENVNLLKQAINYLTEFAENVYVVGTTNIGKNNIGNCIPLTTGKHDILTSFNLEMEDPDGIKTGDNIVNLKTSGFNPITIGLSEAWEIRKRVAQLSRLVETVIPGLTIKLKYNIDIDKEIDIYATKHNETQEKRDNLKNELSCLKKENLSAEKSDNIENEINVFEEIIHECDTKLCYEYNGLEYSLVAIRNGKEFPLSYESDGVRRIISMLALIATAYNEPEYIVAIDEIDAGIFEYLLGEIISVLDESAKGQIIFTSHNLRPLEVLRPKNIYFTTTDENNRFVKITNFSGNNNLRDCYYRNIILGGKDCLYEPTDKYKIEMALRCAQNDEE